MKNSRDDIQIILVKKAASSFWLKLRGLLYIYSQTEIDHVRLDRPLETLGQAD